MLHIVAYDGRLCYRIGILNLTMPIVYRDMRAMDRGQERDGTICIQSYLTMCTVTYGDRGSDE